MSYPSHRIDEVADVITPPSAESSKHMLNALNNHCIQTIFRWLGARDFLIVARVCKRFRDNANSCYPKRLKTIHIVESSDNRFSHSQSIPLNRTLDFLTIFGNQIESLEWGETKYLDSNDALFDSIAELCGKTLKELRISLHRVDFNTKVLFGALEKLDLTDASAANFHMHLQLKSLKLRSIFRRSQPNNDWVIEAFPLLEVAEFVRRYELTDTMIIRFCTLNPQLQSLKLLNCDSLTTSIFLNIGSRLPNLKCLWFITANERFIMDTNMVHLAGLRKLNRLKFGAVNVSAKALVDLIAENELPIEDLEILIKNHDLPNNLPKIRSLKKFELISISDEMLIDLVKNHCNIEQIFALMDGGVSMWGLKKALEYGSSLTKVTLAIRGVDVEGYKSVLALAKDRVHVTITANLVDVPKDVLKENRKWLRIVMM